MFNPILVAGPPRCGSTMITGLFIKHGVWVGECRITNYPETNSQIGTENSAIKKKLKSMLGLYKNWDTPIPEVPASEKNVAELGGFLEDIIPKDMPWIVKTSNLLLTWKIWHSLFPEAIWIFPKRNPDQIVASVLRHPAMGKRPEKKIRKFIGALIERQNVVNENVPYGYPLDIPELVRTRNGKNVVTFAGLEYRQKIATKWIDPGGFHA